MLLLLPRRLTATQGWFRFKLVQTAKT